MNLFELLLTAVGLSMDAFAVAICTGLSMQRISIKKSLTVGLYFGIFQAVMPLIGYLLGSQFADKITAFDHWIAFALLGIIGLKMIKDSFAQQKCEVCEEPSLEFKEMLPLALGTSIDALALGVWFAFLKVRIIPAVSIIGIITLLLSMAGVKIGNMFGLKFKAKAEITGGIILLLMGLKILLEHTGIIGM
ncbi:MAG: manganese efflux pump MntP family protein [Flexilinea sp.]